MVVPEPFRTLGFAGISWIEHYLVHGPGDVQGQPIDLDDEFATFMLKAYEVDTVGARKVRRAFLSRSKGRSKSGFAAMVECFEALGPCRFDHWAELGEVSDWGYEYELGEPVGKPLNYVEVLNVATEEGQAGNTYDAVFYMLHEDTCSPELRRRYGRLDVGLTRINLPDRRGFIEPVTASNESKDGGKSTFIVADETHLWIPPLTGRHKLGKMHQTMVRNLLKRKQASGWMLETSTMYAEGENSVAEGTHAYARALAKAGRADGKLLFDHRQASEDWDLEKRRERIKALREAYGPAAAWMDLESIADYWDDPQATREEFKRFWLNQPVPIKVEVAEDPPVITAEGWGKRKATDPPALDVSPDALGLDRWHDGSTAVAAAWRRDDDVHVELVAADLITDTAGVVDWLVQRAGRRIPVLVVSDSPAASLIPDLKAKRVKVKAIVAADYARACGGFVDDLPTHASQGQLDAAVSAGRKRAIGRGGAWGWDRARPDRDISGLVAATLAKFGAKTSKNAERTGNAYQRR